MALFKHRVTTASMPDGLMACDVELTKGMIVARKLVEEANKNGGQDNISAVVIKPYDNEVEKC